MSNANWWNKKLGNPNAVPTTPPTSPLPSNVYRPTPQQPNIQVSYDPNQDQLVTRAASARDTERCPNCTSGNYMAPQGTQRKRCYDCGYPLVQAGSGVGGTGSEGPVTPAKQPAQGSGFNPTVIVDRIG
jgi:ribosomal protein S27AE